MMVSFVLQKWWMSPKGVEDERIINLSTCKSTDIDDVSTRNHRASPSPLFDLFNLSSRQTEPVNEFQYKQKQMCVHILEEEVSPDPPNNGRHMPSQARLALSPHIERNSIDQHPTRHLIYCRVVYQMVGSFAIFNAYIYIYCDIYTWNANVRSVMRLYRNTCGVVRAFGLRRFSLPIWDCW